MLNLYSTRPNGSLTFCVVMLMMRLSFSLHLDGPLRRRLHGVRCLCRADANNVCNKTHPRIEWDHGGRTAGATLNLHKIKFLCKGNPLSRGAQKYL
jgi:hypothetical protein